MRHAIDTAPRDGQAVIVENDSTGSYDVAHWSDQVGQWVAENGEPSKVTPTHWHPIPKYFQQEHDEIVDLLSAQTVVVALVAAGHSLHRSSHRGGTHTRLSRFRARDAAAWRGLAEDRVIGASAATRGRSSHCAGGTQKAVTGHPEKFWRMSRPRPDGPSRGSMCSCRRRPRTAHDRSNRSGRIRLPSRRRPRLRDKSRPLARQYIRQALDEERARSAALASELATAQRENETQAAQSRKASEETGQLRQAEAANSAQSLEQERQKTAALAQEAAAARQELTTSTAKHRQALDEERARSAALASNSPPRSAKTRRRQRNCARRARKWGSSSRRKPRTAHNRSNRSGRKRLPSRRRPRLRDKS